ncbi:hypothetical protein K7432_015772, partial [Basidiobolus ranarum]
IQYLNKESQFKIRASSPTASKSYSSNTLNSNEPTSVYQKSKTLLRKASELFTDKPLKENRGLVKSRSNISLREAARSHNDKSSVVNRSGSMSKFVGSVKHRFHHVLSKDKSSRNSPIDC